MATEHKDITDANNHEPKGASTALTRSLYVADGAGSGAWTQINRMGWHKYGDNATVSTPIALTLAATDYELTNDGLNSSLNNSTYRLSGVTNLWDTSSNRLSFTSLSLGDIVDWEIRLDFIVGTGNTELTFKTELGVGATPVTRTEVSGLNFIGAGTYPLILRGRLFMEDTNSKDNPGRFLIQASKTGATVTVRDMTFTAITRGGM
jgi:hypothetical protein